MQTLGEDEEATSLLPSAQEIAALPLDRLIDALRAAAGTTEGADVVTACLLQLYKLVQRSGTDEAAVQGGAIGVTIQAMGAHPSSAAVQASACEVLMIMLLGAHDADADAATKARLQLALDAGALATVIRAVNEHGAVEAVAQRGLMALGVIVGRHGGLRRQALALGSSAQWLDLAHQVAGGHAADEDEASMMLQSFGLGSGEAMDT